MILLSPKFSIASSRWGGGVSSLYKLNHSYVAPQGVFEPFWSATGCRRLVDLNHFDRESENVYGIDRPRMRERVWILEAGSENR